eukprot:NODE_11_length_54881_cov_1.430718.p5 type:complete len:663 gc:universal NODE_11_length_54881_cov_1.430718:30744-28756(-)
MENKEGLTENTADKSAFRKKPSIIQVETNSGDPSTLKKVKRVVKSSEQEEPKSPTSINESMENKKNSVRKVTRGPRIPDADQSINSSLDMSNGDKVDSDTLKRDGSPLRINFEGSTNADFTLESIELVKNKKSFDDLSITNLSVIDLKPEEPLNFEPPPKVDKLDDETDESFVRTSVALEFPEIKSRNSKPAASNIAPTQGRRAIKKVDQGDRSNLISMSQSKSRNTEIRQGAEIIEKVEEKEETQDAKIEIESNSDESSEGDNNAEGKFNAKNYELKPRPAKKPEVIKSFRKDATSDSQKLSDKLRSVRSHEGVPFVGLVKEQKTRAIKIENERADMGWAAIKFNRFQKNALFAIENFKKSFSLWEGTIRTLEGKFGTGVGSFFRLLRWLVLTNLMTAILYSIAFIPAAQTPKGLSGAAFYATFPSYINFDADNYTASAPLLLLLIIVFLVFSMVQMLRRLRDEYLKDNRISSDEKCPFSTAAFTSWNFGTKGKEASLNQYFAIANVFRTLITAEEIEEKKKEYKNKLFLARRICGVLITCLLLGISAMLIVASVTKRPEWNTFTQALKGGTGNSSSIDSSKDTPFLIATLNLILPSMFEIIAKIMTFADPVTEQAFAIFLSFFAKMGVIYFYLGIVCSINHIYRKFWQYMQIYLFKLLFR